MIDIDRIRAELMPILSEDGWTDVTESKLAMIVANPFYLGEIPDCLRVERVLELEPNDCRQSIFITEDGTSSIALVVNGQIMPMTFNPDDGIARRALTLIWKAMDGNTRTCRQCGCTDDDCSKCIEKTGEPCHWVTEDLCSSCAMQLR